MATPPWWEHAPWWFAAYEKVPSLHSAVAPTGGPAGAGVVVAGAGVVGGARGCSVVGGGSVVLVVVGSDFVVRISAVVDGAAVVWVFAGLELHAFAPNTTMAISSSMVRSGFISWMSTFGRRSLSGSNIGHARGVAACGGSGHQQAGQSQ